MHIQINTHNIVSSHIAFLTDNSNLLVSTKWKENNPSLFSCAMSYIEQNKSKLDDINSFYSQDATTLYIIPLPKQNTSFLEIASQIGKALLKQNIVEASLCFPGNNNPISLDDLADIIEGLYLGNYSYSQLQTKPKYQQLSSLFIYSDMEESLFTQAITQGETNAEAICLARDLGNTPANLLTPSLFQKQAKEVAKATNLNFFSLSHDVLVKEGLNLISAVGQGSDEKPLVVGLRYSYNKQSPTLLLVGKGITFDSGGICLKQARKMNEMKFDMCGASAVLGAMQIIGKTKPQVNVIALLGLAENLPSSRACKPGDVATAYNGKTVEILNTDAEGRLILADCLAYGIDKFNPTAIVNIATLTGACIVALGKEHSGAITNDQTLYAKLAQIGQEINEPLWQLPLSDRYREAVKGTITDLKNMGTVAEASSICAGAFLENFVSNIPWVHLDIAGTAWDVKEKDIYPDQGATGVGVKLLAQLAKHWRR